MRAVVLRGVERRPVVQVVNRGDRPRRVRVSVHGSRHPYSVHPAVMGQLIVLSESGKGEGAREAREGEPAAEGGRSREPGEDSEERSGEGAGMAEGEGPREGESGGGVSREGGEKEGGRRK